MGEPNFSDEGRWPYPRDKTEIDKLKRIVHSYRTQLQNVDPVGCRIIDARMALYGESWISEGIDVSRDCTVEEIYAEFGRGFEPHVIHQWARSDPGKIPWRGKRDGRTLYRLADVLAYQVAL
ncbi:hypothetical protein FHT44_005004 [Mycolicibacterium sp. BK634]|nr:hypothetical protein [Mycolicibacterium sp. BK634]